MHVLSEELLLFRRLVRLAHVRTIYYVGGEVVAERLHGCHNAILDLARRVLGAMVPHGYVQPVHRFLFLLEEGEAKRNSTERVRGQNSSWRGHGMRQVCSRLQSVHGRLEELG